MSKNDTASVKKTINGTEYGALYMDPEKVILHAGKVFALMGGDIGSLSASRGAMAIASNIQRTGVMQVLDDCFAVTLVEGKSLGHNGYWKDYFRGKPRELVRVIEFMIEVQFADFFGEIVALAKERVPQLQGLLGSKEQAPA
jgi:hypothetical protein